MCKDRECSISNTTPCVFVFGNRSWITKKENKTNPKPAETNSWTQKPETSSGSQSSAGINSWCQKSSGVNSWNRKDTQANPWSQNSTKQVRNENPWSTDCFGKLDPRKLLTLSEKKQKDLSEYSLFKKSLISNTIKIIQNTIE